MILSEDILALKQMVAEIVDKKVIPTAEECDKTGRFPEELYQELIEMGLGCVYMPEQFGGPGLSKLAAAAIQEELARGDMGVSCTLAATCLASLSVLIAGTEEQQAHWFKTMTETTNFAAFCLTEPGAGSDSAAVRTTAIRDGDDYIINGSKCFISNGGVAGIYTVLASTDRSLGTKGLTAFIVERDREGITIGKEEDKMGMRLSNTTDVVFDSVRIPAKNRLGKEGGGFKIVMKTLDTSRPTIGAQGVGIAQRALDEAVKYAKERVQFNKPIAAFQAIQFALADIAIELETTRQMTYHACDLIDRGLPYTKEAAIVKGKAGEMIVNVTNKALQIFGGYGYMRDYPMEKLVRDGRILGIYEGTTEVQKMVIAGSLLN